MPTQSKTRKFLTRDAEMILKSLGMAFYANYTDEQFEVHYAAVNELIENSGFDGAYDTSDEEFNAFVDFIIFDEVYRYLLEKDVPMFTALRLSEKVWNARFNSLPFKGDVCIHWN